MEKVMVFIDGSNLFFTMIDKGCPMKLDYGKFINKLCTVDRKLIRAYYYDAHLIQADNLIKYQRQQKFFSALSRTEYLELRLGRFERGRQKGVDVKLAVDMIDYAVQEVYDTAILVSGDSDLVPAVKLVKDIGAHVELAFFDECYHLKQIADKMTVLNPNYFKNCQR